MEPEPADCITGRDTGELQEYGPRPGHHDFASPDQQDSSQSQCDRNHNIFEEDLDKPRLSLCFCAVFVKLPLAQVREITDKHGEGQEPDQCCEIHVDFFAHLLVKQVLESPGY